MGALRAEKARETCIVGGLGCAPIDTRFSTSSSLVTGILRGFDQLINLVLDESKETLRGAFPRWLAHDLFTSLSFCGFPPPSFYSVASTSRPSPLCLLRSFLSPLPSLPAFPPHARVIDPTLPPLFLVFFFLFPSSAFPHFIAPLDPLDPYRLTDETRELGLVICRGTQVSLISPVEGTEEIANPFIQAEDEA